MIFKTVFDSVFNEERDVDKLYNFRIVVGENEGHNIPHFHMFSVQDGKYISIKLDKSEYFIHGKYTYTLNSKEKKLLVDWLNSSKITKVIKNFEPKNNWENLVSTWNVVNNDNINPETVNYNLL